MKIIDTHIHLWDLEKHHYPWLVEPIKHFAGDFSPLAKSYLFGDLHDDASDVDLYKCVHIQAEFDHDQDPVIETAWLQSIADNPTSQGMPHGIVAFADLSAPDVEDVLTRHVEHPNMRGIRHMLNYEKDPALRFTDCDHLMSDGNWQRGFRLLAKYNLSFDLQIWPWQMEEAAQLARKIPDVPIVLNHTGMPKDLDLSLMDQWKSGLQSLAEAPQLTVKISGLPLMNKNWTLEMIKPFVLGAIEIMGVDRCMFASNFPVDKLMTNYGRVWEAYAEIVKDFSDEDRAGLFWKNAERYYRI